jgi:hypothetical protein
MDNRFNLAPVSGVSVCFLSRRIEEVWHTGLIRFGYCVFEIAVLYFSIYIVLHRAAYFIFEFQPINPSEK